MRKLLLFSFICTLLIISSCSDDNSPVNNADKVAGSYAGYAIAACQYFDEEVSENQTVIITVTPETNKVNVSYISDSWGTFTIENVNVVESSGKYFLSGDGKTEMGMDGNIKEYKCVFTGSINSSKESPEFTFTMPAVMGGLTITFHQGEYISAE